MKLSDFSPQKEFFIGVDSDGCVFDSMEIKHKKTFTPVAIEIWGLHSIQDIVFKINEHINLYSKTRGINRFPGLLMMFEQLSEMPEVKQNNIVLPKLDLFREFVKSGQTLSNDSLKRFAEGKNDACLQQVIQWSTKSDMLFSQYVDGLEPFAGVREALSAAHNIADTMVVSAASAKGLENDWTNAGLLPFMSVIAGQEAGSKKEQLHAAVHGRYQKDKVLMIGDAPGDLKAAKDNGALFYPIIPKEEEQSWQLLKEEALHKFTAGEYAGQYEQALIENFSKILS